MSNKKRTLITAITLIVIIALSLVGYTSAKRTKPTKPTVTQPKVTTTVAKVEPTSTETNPLPAETTSVETEPVESTNVENTQHETSPVETTSIETDKPTEPTTSLKLQQLDHLLVLQLLNRLNQNLQLLLMFMCMTFQLLKSYIIRKKVIGKYAKFVDVIQRLTLLTGLLKNMMSMLLKQLQKLHVSGLENQECLFC